jgi:L-fuconolactonase
MRIDAHQHFWSLSRGDYGWLTSSLAEIYRDFAPRDLQDMLRRHNIDRTVLVQAAPSIEETEYLLGIADATDFVGKVVGWINFEIADHIRHLERFAAHPKFSGIRPMVQDIPDPEWVHNAELAWAFDAVIDLDLTLDALGYPMHAAPFLRLFERYPDMRVVVDHCLKPRIRDNAFGEWAEQIRRIADNTGATCKLSGIVTEADAGWTVETIRPYAEHVISAFGADRVMWGSDWPVVSLASDYDGWMAAAEQIITDPFDREKIFGGTAARFYRI